jgi:hypothetical protein
MEKRARRPQSPVVMNGLSPVEGKPLAVTFDAGRLSSNGGVVVPRVIAMRLGFAEIITALLPTLAIYPASATLAGSP